MDMSMWMGECGALAALYGVPDHERGADEHRRARNVVVGADGQREGTRMSTTVAGKQCNQCEALYINGLFCHETGCPNSGKRWVEGEWVRFVKCFECGYDVVEGNVCCEQD